MGFVCPQSRLMEIVNVDENDDEMFVHIKNIQVELSEKMEHCKKFHASAMRIINVHAKPFCQLMEHICTIKKMKIFAMSSKLVVVKSWRDQ